MEIGLYLEQVTAAFIQIFFGFFKQQSRDKKGHPEGWHLEFGIFVKWKELMPKVSFQVHALASPRMGILLYSAQSGSFSMRMAKPKSQKPN